MPAWEHASVLRVVLIILCCASLGPYLYAARGSESYARESFDRFAESCCKQHGLAFLNSGDKALVDGESGRWLVNMASRKPQTVEEVRPLIRELVYEHLYLLYHRSYFSRCATDGRIPYELRDELVGFRLSFWDADMERVLPPYVAEVHFHDGKIFYYQADPNTLGLMPPVRVESIADLDLPPYGPEAPKASLTN